MAATRTRSRRSTKIVENVDVLVGNEEDLQKGLGIPGPEVAAKSKLDPSVFFGMMDQVAKKLPNVKIVATTLREVHSTNRHSWSAVAWIEGKTYTAPTAELDVLDRVGGGDGFAAGFIYGLLTGEAPESCAQAGMGARCAADHASRATRRWRRSTRCGRLQRADRRASSGNCSGFFESRPLSQRIHQADILYVSLKERLCLAKVSVVFAVLLIALGLIGYFGHGQPACDRADSDLVWGSAGHVRPAGDEPGRGAAQALSCTLM